MVEAGQGETHGRAKELVKLNAVMAGWGVTILIFTRSLFGFEFGGEAVNVRWQREEESTYSRVEVKDYQPLLHRARGVATTYDPNTKDHFKLLG